MSIRKKIEQFMDNAVEECRATLKAETIKVFDKYPLVTSFTWVGYSPYFADGDELVYYTRPYHTRINDVLVGEYYGDPPKFDSLEDAKLVDPMWAGPFYKDMWAIIDDIPEDILKTIFGDHMSVTHYRDGNIKSEPYTDHD